LPSENAAAGLDDTLAHLTELERLRAQPTPAPEPFVVSHHRVTPHV
jgi:hypothetical protein